MVLVDLESRSPIAFFKNRVVRIVVHSDLYAATSRNKATIIVGEVKIKGAMSGLYSPEPIQVFVKSRGTYEEMPIIDITQDATANWVMNYRSLEEALAMNRVVPEHPKLVTLPIRVSPVVIAKGESVLDGKFDRDAAARNFGLKPSQRVRIV